MNRSYPGARGPKDCTTHRIPCGRTEIVEIRREYNMLLAGDSRKRRKRFRSNNDRKSVGTTERKTVYWIQKKKKYIYISSRLFSYTADGRHCCARCVQPVGSFVLSATPEPSVNTAKSQLVMTNNYDSSTKYRLG